MTDTSYTFRTYRGPAEDLVPLCRLFNAALGPEFLLDSRLWLQTIDHDPSFDPSGVLVAEQGSEILGCVVARVCRVPLGSDGLKGGQGWIHLLVVHPQHQRKGLGGLLLQQAHAWLQRQGARQVLTGGNPGHLFPGVPTTCEAALSFFAHHGYVPAASDCHDLARDLEGFTIPAPVSRTLAQHPAFRIHPCTTSHVPALLQFLEQTFPGRWLYETRLRLEQERSPQDIMLLTLGARVAGFAHTFQGRSARLGPSVYWRRALGDGYGGLGPMGVAADIRGAGWGLALLAHSVQSLKADGVARMAIDWTVLVSFYGACGFAPWRTYRAMARAL